MEYIYPWLTFRFQGLLDRYDPGGLINAELHVVVALGHANTFNRCCGSESRYLGRIRICILNPGQNQTFLIMSNHTYLGISDRFRILIQVVVRGFGFQSWYICINSAILLRYLLVGPGQGIPCGDVECHKYASCHMVFGEETGSKCQVAASCTCIYRDRRVERHSKYISHLASLMSNIVSDKCS